MGKIVTLKTVEFGGKTLQLRLDGKTIVRIENRLNKSMLALFMNGTGMNMPKVGELLLVLQMANTNHGVKEEEMTDLYDAYVGQGNSYMDLFQTVQESLDEAGFFGKKKDESATDGASPLLVEETDEMMETKAEDSLA
ncbi:DUF6096 family protein [Dellaglioa algida]|uniref:Uncharacterized protein n=1 Tax=Dellaglioa algida TaxID=105612 RepID=A0A5C6MBA9_9LACO|nr:DUF6096 family protein [Dellaglioa algida]MDK1716635.1 DUF6096 family protein [Dellaglioa algida]MDK1720228.1 DUF6096 family protein [Dellaglioa algida]MDK1721577.1 DUF6096 family protein [Dellaglioa algida]MDK1723618.1 DUF6096 family protein [Dellaglioa algida]TWW10254.1 hypothetical protein LABALGLTS371_15420 [Dellaglioa algida]